MLLEEDSTRFSAILPPRTHYQGGVQPHRTLAAPPVMGTGRQQHLMPSPVPAAPAGLVGRPRGLCPQPGRF